MSEQGYIPPQAIDLEEAVLGSILIQKDAINTVAELLNTECFYFEAHSIIFQNMMQLFETSQPIDLLTLTDKLRKRKALDKIGGASYLTELSSKVNSLAHLETHCRIIQEKYVARKYITVFTQASKDLYDQSNDMANVLDRVEKTTMEIHYMMNKRSEKDMHQVITKTIKAIEVAASKEGNITGIASGHPDIDKSTGGWQDTDLIIIAARPGIGKTTFVLHSILTSAQMFNIPIGLFSLEMSDIQLGQKMISSVTGINNQKMRLGQVVGDDWAVITEKGGNLAKLPLIIDDSAAIDILDIKSKARNWVKKYGIKMIVIDYLQLIQSRGRHNNKNEFIEYITSQLKAIAKELEIPVICLSQLSRKVEERGNKRPMLSDLRDSGAIEQDADAVIFLYREDYYSKDPVDAEGNSLAGVTEITFAKHRNGALDTFYKEFRKETSQFLALQDGPDIFSQP